MPRLKAPDGSIYEFDDDDPEIAQAVKAGWTSEAAAPPVNATAAPMGGAGANNTDAQPLGTLAAVKRNVANAAGEISSELRGAGASVAARSAMVMRLLSRGTNAVAGVDPYSEQAYQSDVARLQPRNQYEAIGRGVERTSEYFIPGTAATKLGKLVTAAPRAAAIGLEALGAGGVSKLQGDDFTTGAISGGLGRAGGEALSAIAPALIKGVMPHNFGVRTENIDQAVKAAKMHQMASTVLSGEAPGLTLPGLSRGAQRGIKRSGGALDVVAAANPNVRLNTRGAVRVIDNQMAKTVSDRELRTLELIRKQLAPPVAGGTNLGRRVSPEEIIQLRRDLPGNRGIIKQVRKELSNELHSKVPETIPHDAKISRLMDVKKAANINDARNSFGGSYLKNRLGFAAGGAAIGGTTGGFGGRDASSTLGGAALGGAAVLGLGSPAARIIAARTLRNAVPLERGIIQGGRQLFSDANDVEPDEEEQRRRLLMGAPSY